MKIRRLIVRVLSRTCTFLDGIPGRWDGRWYRYGQWGCQLRLGSWSANLDERWHTGVWATSPEWKPE